MKTILAVLVSISLSAGVVYGDLLREDVVNELKGSIEEIPVSMAYEGDYKEISLDGSWKYMKSGDNDVTFSKVDLNDSGWDTMNIPSNWYLKGGKEFPGKKGLNYNGTMWFRSKFSVPEKLKSKVVLLRLSMIDYFSEVFINGYYVGSHEGYFQTFKFNVMDKLKYGEENTIAIRVNAPRYVVDFKEEHKFSWPQRQRDIKGIFGYHDTRPGAKTARGQEYCTGGIIGGVALEVKNWASFEGCQVTPFIINENLAKLKLKFYVDNHLDRERLVEIKAFIKPSNFNEKISIPVIIEKILGPGRNVIEGEVEVANPKLWWSWDYGMPNLYEIKADLRDTGHVIDSTGDRFGIRSISVNEKWEWFLNGKRIFPRGSNYIATQWMSQFDKSNYIQDVEMMIDCNLNTMRVHAHVDKKEFYEVCDELGLMVFQDFTLQWGYADEEVVHRQCKLQQRDMIEMLYNHPSIIAWCCHNESPWTVYYWMNQKDPMMNHELDRMLEKDAKNMDPARVVHVASGYKDGHPYHGWYMATAEDYYDDKEFRFITEYGAQAIPCYESTVKMFSKEALWPDTEEDWKEWEFHCFQKKETFNIAGIKQGKDIKEFIDNSQTYQAALCKFATQSFRWKKYKPVAGIYHFMFVEDFPGITWAVVDYNRIPKKGFYALKESMQPVLPCIQYHVSVPTNKVTLWAINDLHKDFKSASMKWKLTGNDGNVIVEGGREIELMRDSIQKVASVKGTRAIYKDEAKLEVWIDDSNGNRLGTNTLTRQDLIID